jgi:hypothetical protein
MLEKAVTIQDMIRDGGEYANTKMKNHVFFWGRRKQSGEGVPYKKNPVLNKGGVFF